MRADSQIQGNADLINILDQKHLKWIVWQVQENDHHSLACSREWGNVSLANMSDPRFLNLDLAVNQVQDNMGLINIADSRHLDLAI